MISRRLWVCLALISALGICGGRESRGQEDGWSYAGLTPPRIEGFSTRGKILHMQSRGDLNGDGLKDWAGVFPKRPPATIEQVDSPELPCWLVAALTQPDGSLKACAASKEDIEPLTYGSAFVRAEHLRIKDGVLELELNGDYRGHSEISQRYRWEGSRMRLLSWTYHEGRGLTYEGRLTNLDFREWTYSEVVEHADDSEGTRKRRNRWWCKLLPAFPQGDATAPDVPLWSGKGKPGASGFELRCTFTPSQLLLFLRIPRPEDEPTSITVQGADGRSIRPSSRERNTEGLLLKLPRKSLPSEEQWSDPVSKVLWIPLSLRIQTPSGTYTNRSRGTKHGYVMLLPQGIPRIGVPLGGTPYSIAAQ